MDTTNIILWSRKICFGSVVSCDVDFQQNLGWKSTMGPSSHHDFCCHWQPQGPNKQEPTLLFFHMDLTKKQCIEKKEFNWFCGVMQRWYFEKNLGWKWVMYSNSQHNFCGPWKPRGPNKQEPTTLILPFGSNKHHPMDKEEFHWVCGVMRRWFSAKLGLKISDVPQQHTISVATDNPRDLTNRNQPLLFFHMDPTNTILWTRKICIGSVVSCGVDFQHKTWVENDLWEPSVSTISVATDSPGNLTNRNQPLLFFHMDPTNIVARTRKSFIGSVVSCGVDFQQNLGWKSVMYPNSQHNFCGHWQPQGPNKQEPTTLILPYGFNKHHPMDKEEFHWLCGVMRRCFSAKLGLKISDVLQQSAQFLLPLTIPGT
jgi:hypothetical protein